ncbi:MAG: chaperone modulator CbpM [Candidatus Berkiella sp.]
MKKSEPIVEGVLQDATITYTITEIQTLCVIDKEMLEEMIAFGVLEPAKGETFDSWVFDYMALHRAKRALRLHQDLAINWSGIALVLDLLDELQELRQTVAVLKHL